jgi:hypothetical protein
MSTRAKWVVGALALVIVLVPVLMILARDTRPDDVLIREALQESLQASREGRPGGVLDLLSQKFKINDVPGLSRQQIARYIRDSKPLVEISNQTPIIHGDTAEIVSDVTVDAKISEFGFNTRFQRTFSNVKMVFAKEGSTKFLFVPAKTWRLTDVVLSGDDAAVLDMAR